MKRLIWLPVAGFLLIAGAAVAAAAPSVASTAADLFKAPVSAAGSLVTGSGPEGGLQDPLHLGGAGLFEEVLADLVSQGVITQEQSDAIVEAMTAKADEYRAEMEAQREQLRQNWEQIQGFMEDGVITQDEVDQLPEDSRFRQMFNSIAEDGQLNVDELEGLGPGFGPGFGHGRGHHGPGMWDDDSSSDTDTDPSTDNSGANSNS